MRGAGGGGVISPSSGTRVLLACGPTDLRKSFDGLCGLAASRLAEDPRQGALFVFCNRDRTRIKVLYFDGSGLWVCAKRLEKGRFSWPDASAGEKAAIGAAELSMLLGGLEMARARRKRWWRAEGA